MIPSTVGAPGALTAALPHHPRTGLQAIGVTRRGPIWPVMGGSQPTGEPAPADAGQAGQEPEPTQATTEPSGQAPPTDISSLPDWAQREIRTVRDEAARHRTAARDAQQQVQAAQAERDRMLAAMGYVRKDAPAGDTGGGGDDQLAALRQRLDEREARDAAIAWTGGVEAAVKGIQGVDGARLMDSRAFIDSLDQFTDDDPSDPAVRQRIADHVRQYVVEHKSFAATTAGRAPARSGGDHPGGSGTADPITEADLERMTPAQIEKAFREGRLKHLL